MTSCREGLGYLALVTTRREAATGRSGVRRGARSVAKGETSAAAIIARFSGIILSLSGEIPFSSKISFNN